MKTTLQLTNNSYSYGSFNRADYKLDIIYTAFQYKEISMLYNLNLRSMTFYDGLAEQMLCNQCITREEKEQYENLVLNKLSRLEEYDNYFVEQVYDEIHQMRKESLGIEAIEKQQRLKAQQQGAFKPVDGFNQSSLKDTMIASSKAVIMIITQMELFYLMKEDIDTACANGKKVYIVISKERGNDVPSKELIEDLLDNRNDINYLSMNSKERVVNLEEIQFEEELQNQIENEKVGLLFYGEDGFLQCKALKVPSVVYGATTGYFTKAMTNQFSTKKKNIIYIPKDFDITEWVALTKKTRMSYWQMNQLWKDYGDEIYQYKVEELYLKYPQYFLNIYTNGEECVEAKEGYPIQIKWPKDTDTTSSWIIIRQFDKLKDEAIKEYLNKQEGLCYYSTYFDENLEEMDIPWKYEGQQTGILVQAIRASKAGHSKIINCEGDTTVRNIVETNPKDFSLQIISNFLFFLTPRLTQVYNEIRKDREQEQLSFNRGHLDYMLYYENGKRIETFPLFKKACIGMLEDGRFLFFNYELGGGTLKLSGNAISFDAFDINVEEQQKVKEKAVCIYTPSYAKADLSREELADYRVLVGEDRINIVIIQNNIICIRKGAVALSGLGVVVSLEKEKGEELLRNLNLSPLEDGYYDCSEVELSIRLEKPKEVSKEDWDKITWAYGGGLSLILDGEGLCDKGNIEQWLSSEGWMSALSRQTQESEIQKLVKHPRTAIGIAKNGDLVILVYSGRSRLSVGADYNEMCQIARKLFPDIWCMMNVDGGGSAMLGMAIGNSFIELSYPATSLDNCAAMVRPINTILCLKQ